MKPVVWIFLNPRMPPDDLGFIPGFISGDDPRPLKEQIDANYGHGGGWHNQPGFTFDHSSFVLSYPEDPPLPPQAMAVVRDETLLFYQYSICVILQKDGSFEVCRVD